MVLGNRTQRSVWTKAKPIKILGGPKVFRVELVALPVLDIPLIMIPGWTVTGLSL